MSEYQISAALLRTRVVARAARPEDSDFEAGRGTRPATQAHLRQAAHGAAERVVAKAVRQRPTSQARKKDIERRRTWAGGSSMPPGVRARYSEAERAALSVIAEQCKRNGFCALCINEIGRLAGVSRTSVQNAVRKARSKEYGHISVRERPQDHGKNLENIIKLVCKSWIGWIARAIGFKRLNTSETKARISLFQHDESADLACDVMTSESVSRNGCDRDRRSRRRHDERDRERSIGGAAAAAGGPATWPPAGSGR